MRYLILLAMILVSGLANAQLYSQGFETVNDCSNNPCPNSWNPAGYTCDFTDCKYFGYGCIHSSTGQVAVVSGGRNGGRRMRRGTGNGNIRDIILPDQLMTSGQSYTISFWAMKRINGYPASVIIYLDEPGAPTTFVTLATHDMSSVSAGTWALYSYTYNATASDTATFRIGMQVNGGSQRLSVDDIEVSNFVFTKNRCEQPLVIPINIQLLSLEIASKREKVVAYLKCVDDVEISSYMVMASKDGEEFSVVAETPSNRYVGISEYEMSFEKSQDARYVSVYAIYENGEKRHLGTRYLNSISKQPFVVSQREIFISVINRSNSLFSYEVLDVLGRKIKEGKTKNTLQILLPSGVYVINLSNRDTTETRVVIKQ